MSNNKKIFSMVILFISCLSLGYFEHYRHDNFRQQLARNGMSTQAISFDKKCGRHQFDRFYRYQASGKSYEILEFPDDKNVNCKSELGDKIDLIYLANDPEKYMTKWKFDKGTPALIHYLAMSILWFLGIIMILEYFYRKVSKFRKLLNEQP